MKDYYDCIFVLLVYANTDDLKEYIESVARLEFRKKIIVVNSYYDDLSAQNANQIARDYRCDYICVENKGYSAGNNRGIEFAVKNYEFEYLIVSNPDMVVQSFDFDYLKSLKCGVVGPKIVTMNGKNQNPFYVDKKRFPKAEYYFLRKRNKLGYFSIIMLNKIVKMIFFAKRFIFRIHESRVYAVHGSFIIFHKETLEKMGSPFDENIFLFCEEMALAEEMKKNGVTAIYTDKIVIKHKEDGSMSFLNGSMLEKEIESNGYVVKKYFCKK